MKNSWDSILSTPEPEKAGARTASRLDFQVCWSVHFALDKYDEEKEEYAISLEFQDDVCYIDNKENPNFLDFFQVKGKGKSNWKIKDISPILAKLLQHKNTLPDFTRNLTFVSNIRCEFHPDEQDKVSISTFSAENFQKLANSLKPEYNISRDDKIFFEYTPISLEESEQNLKGYFCDFLQKHIGDINVDINKIFDAFVQEFRRKSKTYLTSYSDNVKKFIESKCITRNHIENLLNRIISGSEKKADWTYCRAYLDNNAFSTQDIKLIRKNWEKYEAEKLYNFENLSILNIENYVNIELGNKELNEIISNLNIHSQNIKDKYQLIYENDFIRAAILYETILGLS